MTALKPTENRRVRAVAAEQYELNAVCAHPECAEPTADPHHAFPRSQIKGTSWFVEIMTDVLKEGQASPEVKIIPHVVGLCGSGTTGHHGDVEEHRAWIKLEDGVWNWYDFVADRDGKFKPPFGEWVLVGPLNPQPGQQVGKPKRKRFKGEQRRKRRTISIRVPDDTENGGEIWDETLDEVREALIEMELYDETDKIPAYEAIIAALRDWLNS